MRRLLRTGWRLLVELVERRASPAALQAATSCRELDPDAPPSAFAWRCSICAVGFGGSRYDEPPHLVETALERGGYGLICDGCYTADHAPYHGVRDCGVHDFADDFAFPKPLPRYCDICKGPILSGEDVTTTKDGAIVAVCRGCQYERAKPGYFGIEPCINGDWRCLWCGDLYDAGDPFSYREQFRICKSCIDKQPALDLTAQDT